MTQQIFYLMTGPSHLPNLVVSLRSLRRHYQGQVVVHAWVESHTVAERICQDPRFAPIQCVYRHADYKGKNAQEYDKLDISANQPDGQTTIYLDADTIICKPLDDLFNAAERQQFACTQFVNWTMRNKTPYARVERLLKYPIPCDHVLKALERNRPSLNSGIYAHISSDFTREVFKLWRQWTYECRKVYISGETTLHPLVAKYNLQVLWGGQYNCSPKFQPANLPDEDVVIWHFHGDTNTKRNGEGEYKSEIGVDLWWPEFDDCLAMNYGYMGEWIDRVPNDHLKVLIKERLNP